MSARTEGMTLDEIKAAVEAGETVHWANDGYTVVKDNLGQWLIVCGSNGYTVGLTWRDGVTVNGDAADFYTEDLTTCPTCGKVTA